MRYWLFKFIYFKHFFLYYSNNKLIKNKIPSIIYRFLRMLKFCLVKNSTIIVIHRQRLISTIIVANIILLCGSLI